jgi:hypothetical protein
VTRSGETDLPAATASGAPTTSVEDDHLAATGRTIWFQLVLALTLLDVG